MFYSSSALFLGTGINLFSQKVGITFLDLTTVRIRGEAGMNTDLLTKKLTARSGSVLNFTDPASLTESHLEQSVSCLAAATVLKVQFHEIVDLFLFG